jgi:hypothetical protein
LYKKLETAGLKNVHFDRDQEQIKKLLTAKEFSTLKDLQQHKEITDL